MDKEKEIKVWSSLSLYCTLSVDSYNLWAVRRIACAILTASGFASFILVQRGCRTKSVQAWGSQCTMNVSIISTTGLEFFPHKLCLSPMTDIFQNLAPTHHTHVSEISHCSKQHWKNIQERWICTGEYWQLCYSHISQFKLSDNSATAAKIFILRIKSHLWERLLQLTIL